jgi:hypothetical protein
MRFWVWDVKDMTAVCWPLLDKQVVANAKLEMKRRVATGMKALWFDSYYVFFTERDQAP